MIAGAYKKPNNIRRCTQFNPTPDIYTRPSGPNVDRKKSGTTLSLNKTVGALLLTRFTLDATHI